MSRYCPAIRRDCPHLTPTPEELVEMLGAAKNSGRLAGLREAREAVKILEVSIYGMEENDWCGELADGNCFLDDDCEDATADQINDCIRSGCPYQDMKKAIAAIDRLMGGK